MSYRITISDRSTVVATETGDSIVGIVESFRRLLPAHLNPQFTDVAVQGDGRPWEYGIGNSQHLLSQPEALQDRIEEMSRNLHAFLHRQADYGAQG